MMTPLQNKIHRMYNDLDNLTQAEKERLEYTVDRIEQNVMAREDTRKNKAQDMAEFCTSILGICQTKPDVLYYTLITGGNEMSEVERNEAIDELIDDLKKLRSGSEEKSKVDGVKDALGRMYDQVTTKAKDVVEKVTYRDTLRDREDREAIFWRAVSVVEPREDRSAEEVVKGIGVHFDALYKLYNEKVVKNGESR